MGKMLVGASTRREPSEKTRHRTFALGPRTGSNRPLLCHYSSQSHISKTPSKKGRGGHCRSVVVLFLSSRKPPTCHLRHIRGTRCIDRTRNGMWNNRTFRGLPEHSTRETLIQTGHI